MPPVEHVPAPPKPGFRAWWTVGLLCGLYIISYIGRIIPSLLVGPLKQDFNVNDFGSIMVGLPQTIAVSVVPDSVSHHSQLVYNVYAGSLDWAFQASGSNGCICFSTPKSDRL